MPLFIYTTSVGMVTVSANAAALLHLATRQPALSKCLFPWKHGYTCRCLSSFYGYRHIHSLFGSDNGGRSDDSFKLTLCLVKLFISYLKIRISVVKPSTGCSMNLDISELTMFIIPWCVLAWLKCQRWPDFVEHVFSLANWQLKVYIVWCLNSNFVFYFT